VNARERFFGQTVLGQAARGKRPELVRWLLEKGSTDADSALDFAVQTGDVALAKRAVASGHLEPLDLLAYRKQAEAKDSKTSNDRGFHPQRQLGRRRHGENGASNPARPYRQCRWRDS